MRNPLRYGSISYLVDLFSYTGTLDNSPYFSVPTAIEFRDKVCGGEEAIRSYNNDLALRAGKLVAEKLGTEILAAHDKRYLDCPLINVRLPFDFGRGGTAKPHSPEQASEVAFWVAETVMDEKNSAMQIFPFDGEVYVRLSAQAYLEISDFEWAADVLLELCERAKSEIAPVMPNDN